jgi:hypothetical protein
MFLRSLEVRNLSILFKKHNNIGCLKLVNCIYKTTKVIFLALKIKFTHPI